MAGNGERRFVCLWKGVRPNDEELEQIQADHRAWLAAGDEGDPPHDLRGINLIGRNLRRAYLLKADLRKAKLSRADLQEADLRWAKLQNTDLTDARLSLADLQGADLRKAKLGRADLSEAHLRDVNLQGAVMRRADLREATLFMVDLSGADVAGVRYDRKTKCRSVRVDDCFGSPRFKRFVLDQDYLAEFKEDHPLWYRLWWLFADCGRSIGRWALWSAGLAYGFAVLFFHGRNLGWLKFKGPYLDAATQAVGQPWTFETALYYSVVTFTTLGFGDITPQDDKAAMWVMAEVVVGYIMLGGLISILANKLARRS